MGEVEGFGNTFIHQMDLGQTRKCDDVGEEVASRPRDPRFGGKAAVILREFFVVEEVDDDIEHLW